MHESDSRAMVTENLNSVTATPTHPCYLLLQARPAARPAATAQRIEPARNDSHAQYTLASSQKHSGTSVSAVRL